jgi:amidase
VDELLTIPALELAAAIQRGALGAEEVTRYFLDRIARHDGPLSSFTAVAPRRARRAAAALDRARARGRAGTGLWGLPIGVKDLNLVRGLPARMGSASLSWLVSPIDDIVARRFRAAGLVILGKTSTSELGILPVVETIIHPPTRNPHAPGHTSGGSSGGAGAALAAGLLPIAHGSDAGGSIRIPAAFAGVFGYKSTRRALVTPHAKVDTVGLAVEGPLARTALDAAALADVLRPDGAPSLLEAARRAPGRLRVHVAVDGALAATDPEIRAAVLDFARALAAAGHDVEAPAPFVGGTLDEFLPVMQHMIGRPFVPFAGRLQPVTRWMREEGRRVPEPHAMALVAALEARLDAWFGAADVWLTPTVAIPAPPVGRYAGLAPRATLEAVVEVGAFTAPFNMSGFPAVSIPVGRTRAGLPIGAQLVMRRGQDGPLLALAAALEAAGLWRSLPPAGLSSKSEP